jgi:peptidoglycan hydrolase-like protein with peptidoglycan-binding domain
MAAAALFACAPLLPPLAAPAAAQSRAETLNAAQIQQVQEILRSLGYDPGPADGIPGSRTLLAVSQFQQQMGLPQTGRLDLALWRTLTGEAGKERRAGSRGEALAETAATALGAIETAAGAAAPAKAQPAAKAAAPAARPAVPAAGTAGDPPEVLALSLVRGEWEILDEDGARQKLRFVSGGTVSDALIPKFWRWRTENDLLVIRFDNGAGGWVNRVGRLVSENRIEGSAESSRKRSWSWTATRR